MFHAENRELTGAVDLLSYYGLREQYDKFCLKVLPASIGESHYLKDVVGDIDIRKGEDMELGQLLGLENENFNVHLHQFNIDILQQAFSFKESGLISLPEVRKEFVLSSHSCYCTVCLYKSHKLFVVNSTMIS